MTFAESIAKLNEWHFFQEFVYSKTTFRPSPNQTEVELADNVLWIRDILFAFQLKEREASSDASELTERKWFERKVLNQATRQIRDTMRYLEENRTISLQNHRGHEHQLELESISQLHKLVVYLPNRLIPKDCLAKKYHKSDTVGNIHIVPAHDYLGIVQTLLTPAEVADYFDFREELIEQWGDKLQQVPEPALVGQFLDGDSSKEPSQDFFALLTALNQDAANWDVSGIISKFPDKITSDNKPTDYYQIISELALLKRNELKEFKSRFQLAIEKSRAEQFTRPYRMAIPRTDCGFVFIPLNKEFVPNRRNALQNMTLAHKYDLRLSKCIGVTISNHQDGWFDAEWFYISAQWIPDAVIEELLAENNPFREVSVGEIQRYSYKDKPRI